MDDDISATPSDVVTTMRGLSNYSADVGAAGRDVSYYSDIVTMVTSPVQLLIGFVGNALCVYVSYVAVDVITPIAAYAAILASVDSAILIVDVGSEWLTLVFDADLNRDVISRSDTTCKTFYFVRHFLLHLASWLMVCVAIELLRLTRNRKLLNYFRGERIVDTFVLLLVVLSTLNVHYFWTYGVSSVQFKLSTSDGASGALCTFVAKNLQGYYEDESCQHILDQLHWVIADIVPIVIVTVSLVLIRHTRAKEGPSGDTRLPLTGHIGGRTPDRKRKPAPADGGQVLVQRSYWLLLVLFVAFKLPYVVACQVSDALFVGLKDSAAWALWLALLKASSNMNHSGKVFVYGSTWPFFRNELRKIFRRKRESGRDVRLGEKRQKGASKFQITAI
ncbi:hypothetical protein LSH36_342g00000 [Paralvinella palmiformis]|uniref:G-protein coupled receptors family 1 profile domain-containing protein n=1 Tax=Paralvinella palmiformis TaxID=53620 RepID=A0AAD9JFW0_9ANNE|nr:hypothetical protein LSH36_342g00000 [Paralvinella palmiformis]